MGNARANKGGNLQLIANHIATGTESTFEFSFGALDKTKITHLILICRVNTTAQLALQMQINQITTNYFDDGKRIIAGAETLLNAGAAAHNIIASSTLIGTGARGCHVEVHIYLGIGSPSVQTSHSHATPTSSANALEEVGHMQNSVVTSLTHVKVFTSTSTWAAGTVLTLYKVTI